MNKESIEVEYKETYATMRGISPKHPLYIKLQAKLVDLRSRMDKGPVKNMGKFLGKKNNRFIKNPPKVPQFQVVPIPKKTICNKSGCTNIRRRKGRTKSGGIKYCTRCVAHHKEDKLIKKPDTLLTI